MFNFFKRKKEKQSPPSTLSDSTKQIESLDSLNATPTDQPNGKKIEVENVSRSIEIFTLENCPDTEDLRDLL